MGLMVHDVAMIVSLRDEKLYKKLILLLIQLAQHLDTEILHWN